ncbi:protein-tyrosine phosphatase-like protein [Podospora australis]|uniref:Protein-tyrosine phosphatase-like protein n=1 Tax=Podospora australis TaxID=1536484 RepID=A0AAN6X1M1_9PEZI|nr:protein-tyrosine phosphatase-like protein [Podospora australis]
MELDNQEILRHGVVPTTRYDQRPPEAPIIFVPHPHTDGITGGQPALVIRPSFEGADASQFTEEQIRLITNGAAAQSASGAGRSWKWEYRREAQPILDHLYLGPSSAARDRDFLVREGITMVLAVQDSRFPTNIYIGAQRVAESLGIALETVGVASLMDLIRAFPEITRIINTHLLQVYRAQGRDLFPDPNTGLTEKVAIDTSNYKHGKVLLVCETGNERSAAAAAAYIMSVYDANLITAMQFVSLKRFCAVFSEDAKQLLLSYNDILTAQRQVHAARNAAIDNNGNHDGSKASEVPMQSIIKRTIEEFAERGDYEPEQRETGESYRYTPFVDQSGGDGGASHNPEQQRVDHRMGRSPPPGRAARFGDFV